MKRLCVFAGSRFGDRDDYRIRAEELGTEMAKRGLGLVYGGGKVGLMGVLADAVLAGGQSVIGIIPRALARDEVAHDGVTELRVVNSMHERKAQMASLADGFVTLPGGIGTLEEICEILTWAQLGIHRKPCAILEVASYYQPLLQFLDRQVETGFLPAFTRDDLLVDNNPAALIERLRTHEPTAAEPKLDWSGI